MCYFFLTALHFTALSLSFVWVCLLGSCFVCIVSSNPHAGSLPSFRRSPARPSSLGPTATPPGEVVPPYLPLASLTLALDWIQRISERRTSLFLFPDLDQLFFSACMFFLLAPVSLIVHLSRLNLHWSYCLLYWIVIPNSGKPWFECCIVNGWSRFDSIQGKGDRLV